MSALGRFLDAAAAAPFAYGRHDCCLFAADWVRAWHDRDPASAWRGGYVDALGAARLVRQAGGVEALFAVGCASVGLARWHGAPQAGDVGVVAAPTAVGVVDAVGAVCLAGGSLPRWAVLTDGGIAVGAFAARAVWSL